MRQYETFELTFSGEKLADRWADVPLTASFRCGAETKTVKGFYDGDGVYKVRFLPEKPGEYTWKVSGAVNDEGSAVCSPTDDGHHGLVRAVGTHLEYEDGARYIPFGTTVYALMHQTPELIEETMETLQNAPFNKIRLCVFPKDFIYNRNEPELHAFERSAEGVWDVRRPCVAFWQAFERRLEQLFDMGYQVDLILFHPYDRWGFSKMTQAEDRLYLEYLLRRFAAYPNLWWSMANEYDVCPYKDLEDWYGIESFLAENDPYHHLIGCHHCIIPYDHARKNITHVSLQTGELFRINEWRRRFGKPVLIDECGYEGNLGEPWGCLSAWELTARFWRSMVLGAYCTHGETYLVDDREIVHWAKGGTLRGESPKRIAFLRGIIESLPGELEPIEQGFLTLRGKSEDEIRKLLKDMPAEQSVYFKRFLEMTPCELERAFDNQVEYMGHIGREAYLFYYDRRCSARVDISLPEEQSYRVEVLDTWEMTRTTAYTEASGKVSVRLPGKEGMAVLAVRNR